MSCESHNKGVGIDFVIVNWNKSNATCNLVERLVAVGKENDRIVIVDNASDRDEWEMLLARMLTSDSQVFEEEDLIKDVLYAIPRISIIRWGSNSGYAGGNNIGLQLALRGSSNRYAWVLNNDMEIPKPEILWDVMSVLSQYPEGDLVLSPPLVAPDGKVRLESKKGAFGLFRTKMVDRKDYSGDKPRLVDTDNLMGCSILFSKHVLWRVGLFDERFFLYGEETDWCYRCKSAGFPLHILLTEPIYHDKNFREENASYQLYYKTRNSFLLISKHRAGIISKIPWILGRIVYILYMLLRAKLSSGQVRKAYLHAVLSGLRDGIIGKVGIKSD